MKKILALLAVAAFATAAFAQTYPNHPVRIVVPFGPGGFTDVVARILQKELGASLGVPIVIENRSGAGSTIGTADVAKAKPDGYSLVIVSTTHVISPHLYREITYDPIKDFAPVTKLGEGPYVLVVHPSLGVSSVAELIAKAKANPGRIDFASSGNGSSQHLVGALFATMAGVKLNHVPYKGSSGAMNDLIAGTVKLSFVGMPNALPNIASGRLKALAVTSSKRAADLPNVPTLAEAGVPGFDATIWLALLAPAGTPRDIVMKLNTDVAKALSTPDVRKLMRNAGVDVATSTPEELGALLQSELDRWGKVVKETGATVN
jgi:tripartite-type tricarboxylate transporter receptor subunit TctC